jgi:hypothetical protein
MRTLVVMSGGFHPFHAGHMALYNAAKRAFPGADVVVGATNVTKDRPFPFQIKQKLAQVAGVDPGHFVEVNRQFSAEPENIAKRIKDPEDTVLIFVRSDKDKGTHPMPARPDPKTGQLPLKKDGTPVSNYLLDYAGNERNLEPLTKHAYMAYLPTVEFGGGLTSASEIRNKWPSFTPQQKAGLVTSMYPVTKNNPALAQNVIKMLDAAIGVAPTPKPAVPLKKAPIARVKENPLRENVLAFIKEGRPLLKEASVEQRFRYVELLKESAFVMNTILPLAIQLFQLMTPKTRDQALEFIKSIRDKHGEQISMRVYKVAQKLKKDSDSTPAAPIDKPFHTY